MRTKKREPDFRAISRRSIQRDFQRVQRYHPEEKRPEIKDLPEISSERRIIFVGEKSSYYRLRSHLLGKLVRIVEKSSVGGWKCEFVHDDDRQALNAAAGWSDRKEEYLFDCIKFKD